MKYRRKAEIVDVEEMPLRGIAPEPWHITQVIKHADGSEDMVSRRMLERDYELIEARDKCQFCLGHKGGTPGNENVIGGVVVCDFCTALHMRTLEPIDPEKPIPEPITSEYAVAYGESWMDSALAAQIKILRERAGMTQADLAEKIGTQQPAISRLEDVNYSEWKVETLRKIAAALGVRLRISFLPLATAREEMLAEVSAMVDPEKPTTAQEEK